MAAKKTYTEAALIKYIGHLTQEGYYEHAPSNEEINMNLHHLNKNLTPEYGDSKRDIIKHYRERKKELYCFNRSDVVTALEWTITAPDALSEEERLQFFEASLSYIKEVYGAENVITGFMHANEGIRDLNGKVLYGHWHAHYIVIPVTKIASPKPIHKNFTEKICNKEVCTLKHLKNWHKNFQDFCDKHLPFKAQVYMNGKTGGLNRSVKEIKAETKYEREHQKVLELENEIAVLKEKIHSLEQQKTVTKEHGWGHSHESSWGNKTHTEDRLW